ncbi:MAG: FeoB-associated Cys-rich membrane protein [Planctomycetales bacterium]|nr:FeoB-associated Cys-rich membrane protein [bacterium]UNM07716.1 MAG: FeoB-associated Cys-rich membrane protein [Planctomycetales bacterium]
MMNITLQWIVTICVVLLAAAFLVRHMLVIGRPSKGCGSGCSSCSRQEIMEKRLASLEEN